MIRLSLPIALLLAFTGALNPVLAAETCADPKGALGVSRIVEIDPTSGPLYGAFSKYQREPRFLGPKEVVLTFDDGPMPRYTKLILAALDKFCTKATFFYVGEMAMAYPDMVKEVIGRGHTVGTHTWSHPMNLRRRSLKYAKDQIERGFAAVALAAGQPIAPFFRFPGLSDSGPMLGYLQERGVATFTVDVVSNDSYIGSPKRLIKRTLAQIEKQDGGIVLFHDIKSSTARALPTILAELKKRGYKVVQLRSKTQFEPLPVLTTELAAKLKSKESKPKLVPFYAAIAPMVPGKSYKPLVEKLAPEARERTQAGSRHASAPETAEDKKARPARARKHRARRVRRIKRNKKKTAEFKPITSLTKAVSGRN